MQQNQKQKILTFEQKKELAQQLKIKKQEDEQNYKQNLEQMEQKRKEYMEMLLKKKSKMRENSWINEDDSSMINKDENNSLFETDDKISNSINQYNQQDSILQDISKINISSQFNNLSIDQSKQKPLIYTEFNTPSKED